jgi:hypothetical protein
VETTSAWERQMKIEKRVLGSLDKVYAVCPMMIDGELRLLFATEGTGACFQYRGSAFEETSVWDSPGGTMTIVPIPGKNGEFLAVQNFFPTFQGENATIVWARPRPDGSWETTTVLSLPFVHRMDVLHNCGINYLIAATICGGKQSRDDWSDPGKVWAGILPDTPDLPIILRPIMEGLVRNHGYSRLPWNGTERAFITSEQGVFICTPPCDPEASWEIEKLLDREVSDIAICDIDEDGAMELLTIEPFHGQTIAINKKIGEKYAIVWRYEDKPVEFGHIAWGGLLAGRPTFLCGYRRLASDFFYVQCASKTPLQFATTIIEPGVGPANVAVIPKDREDWILASNRAIGEAALYVVRKDEA